jgi:hypothetical protein
MTTNNTVSAATLMVSATPTVEQIQTFLRFFPTTVSLVPLRESLEGYNKALHDQEKEAAKRKAADLNIDDKVSAIVDGAKIKGRISGIARSTVNITVVTLDEDGDPDTKTYTIALSDPTLIVLKKAVLSPEQLRAAKLAKFVRPKVEDPKEEENAEESEEDDGLVPLAPVAAIAKGASSVVIPGSKPDPKKVSAKTESSLKPKSKQIVDKNPLDDDEDEEDFEEREPSDEELAEAEESNTDSDFDELSFISKFPSTLKRWKGTFLWLRSSLSYLSFGVTIMEQNKRPRISIQSTSAASTVFDFDPYTVHVEYRVGHVVTWTQTDLIVWVRGLVHPIIKTQATSDLVAKAFDLVRTVQVSDLKLDERGRLLSFPQDD